MKAKDEQLKEADLQEKCEHMFAYIHTYTYTLYFSIQACGVVYKIKMKEKKDKIIMNSNE